MRVVKQREDYCSMSCAHNHAPAGSLVTEWCAWWCGGAYETVGAVGWLDDSSSGDPTVVSRRVGQSAPTRAQGARGGCDEWPCRCVYYRLSLRE
jgi:hypothetical protein